MLDYVLQNMFIQFMVVANLSVLVWDVFKAQEFE
jgi:hypothetical protein